MKRAHSKITRVDSAPFDRLRANALAWGFFARRLVARFACVAVLSVPAHALAQTGGGTQEPVIKPDIERREITIPRIDADDFEIGVYGGILSVEDFGSEPVTGARLGYHLTEDYFVEAALARSEVSDEQFRTLLPSGVFEQPVVDLDYWMVSLGYHMLPGEVFAGSNYAFASGVYVIAGIGNVEFADVSSTMFSLGLGVRALPADWFSIRLEMRDHIFDQDVLGKNKATHNFELTLGLSLYF